jgi:tetratricopeptide (TPR) repeat protein
MLRPVRVRTLCVFLLASAALPAWGHPELGVLERAARDELAARPDDPSLLLQEGYVLQVGGDWSGALVAFAHAAAHGADAAEVAAARGRVFLASGRPAEAKREFDRALRRRPDALAVLFDRGRASWRLGRPESAAHDFAVAAAGMPALTPEHVFEWRDVLLATGRHEAALAALDRGIARIGAVPSLELAAVDLELALGRPEDAVARLDGLLARNPRNEAWMARRGELLAQVGRPAEAREDFRTALALIAARPAERRGPRVEALEGRLRASLVSEAKPMEGTR